MTPLPGLQRRIILAMLSVTAMALLIVLGGLILFQISMRNLAPDLLPDYRVSKAELIAMIVFGGLALGGATIAGARLARRISRPVQAVAAAARAITQSSTPVVEAIPDDDEFEEIAQLVHDFNRMAGRIAQAATDATTLNLAIAHELRTPLTIVKGRLQGFRDGVFVPDEAALKALIHQIDGLARTADDLRTISLAEAKRLELCIADVDLAAEAASVVEVMRPDFVDAGMSLELDPSVIVVPADAARIRQALMALLDNARRYAGKGRVVVQIRSTAEAGILRIQDEGPGIPTELASRIFTVFERGEASRSRSSGGSGLGLTVVEAVAAAHGGSVAIDTSVTIGATFEMRLPRRATIAR